eukprot:234826-Pleurochrysis_carterae.AAC.1
MRQIMNVSVLRRSAETKSVNPADFKRTGDVVDMECPPPPAGAKVAGDKQQSTKIKYRLNISAVLRGDWDGVCSCGWNSCSIGFCEHAAGT